MTPVTSVARELCRSASFTPADQGGNTDGRTLVGYAATFGSPTEIRSWEGHFTETIRAGAFKKSIRERTPVMQFDHGHHPLIGSIPIGSIENLREDEHGLYVEGRISDNWLMQPVRDAIAEGSVSGMSFRFEVVREEWRDASGKVLKDPEEIVNRLYMPDPDGPLQRELVELKVRELGPVVFPAYDSTTVGVRARSVADELTQDSDLADQVRQSLVSDADMSNMDDPDFKREVALALLFERMDAPAESHPSETTDTPENAAPSADGHPAADSTTVRMRADLREVIELMRGVTESISEKRN
jgi:HK97 family phage prohead protease